MTQMTKAVRSKVMGALEDIGFKRKQSASPGYHDFGCGYGGFAGVNVHALPGKQVLSVDLNVGALHWETERLWDEFAGLPVGKAPAPTVFTNIGYLIPAHTFRGYLIEKTADPADTIREILSDMHAYALPWMHDLCDMEKLTALAEKDSPDHAAYRVPILRALQGQPEKAFAAMEYYRMRRQNIGWWLERYAKFEVWFRERLLSRT
jgi:hypothetical protein